MQDWFSFKSKAQRQQELEEFEGRIFPLGELQRTRALEALQALTGEQNRDQELLYGFVSAKDCYLKEGKNGAALQRARRQLLAGRWVKKQQVELVLALVQLDAALGDLAAYPTPEQVRQLAEEQAADPAR